MVSSYWALDGEMLAIIVVRALPPRHSFRIHVRIEGAELSINRVEQGRESCTRRIDVSEEAGFQELLDRVRTDGVKYVHFGLPNASASAGRNSARVRGRSVLRSASHPDGCLGHLTLIAPGPV